MNENHPPRRNADINNNRPTRRNADMDANRSRRRNTVFNETRPTRRSASGSAQEEYGSTPHRSTERRAQEHGNTPRRSTERRAQEHGNTPHRRKPTKEERLRRRRKVLITRAAALLFLIIALIVCIVLIASGDGHKDDRDNTSAAVSEETSSEDGSENGTERASDEETTSGALLTEPGSTIVKPENWNGKTIYLTFDDGPSAVTEEILNVLDSYNVKGTFFTLGFGSEKQYQRLVNSNHSLGVHSYSHDYDTIYASMENFQHDVTTLRNLLQNYTKSEIYLYRFPGGSNNTVHKNAGSMKMSDFANYITGSGMKYMDWNADSQDAAYVKGDADVLFEAAKNDIEYWGENTDQTTIVLLMHDSENKTTGPAMLEKLIPYFLDKGYAFDRITRDTPDIHFELPDE